MSLTKKIIFVIGGIILVLAIIFASIFLFKKHKEKVQEEAISNPLGVWEIMVVLRDQVLSDDPVEDAKGALKRGDVISIREADHEWSKAEYISYLLLKIEAKKDVVDKLLLGVERETGEKDQDGNKIKETVLARKYRIDLDKVGFPGNQTVSGQPLLDKVFGEEVIYEK